MLMRHFSPVLSAFVFVFIALFPAVFIVFGPAAAGAGIETGGYTLGAGETIEGPGIFISEDPEADRIVFGKGAGIDAEVSYEPEQWEKDFAQWEKWHRETGADPARIGDYDLAPLAAFTMGRSYDRITLEEGAYVVNRGSVGEGLKALGSVDIGIGRDAVIHGNWSSLSFGNFEDPGDDGFFSVSVVNRGTLGTFMEDFGYEPFEKTSQQGILFYEGVEGVIVNERSGVIRGEHAGIYTNYREQDEADLPFYDPDPDFDPGDIGYAEGRSFVLENDGLISGEFYGVYEGGGLAHVDIQNQEFGQIDGKVSGIYLSRGGTVRNRGSIEGEATGIFVSTGTADIYHYSGSLAATDEEQSDAIRFGGASEGGTVTLHSSLGGSLRHFGETGDAELILGEPVDGRPASEPLSAGTVYLGEGAVTQQSGHWSLGDIFARTVSLEGGGMRLDGEVEAESGIDIGAGATLTLAGGRLLTGNVTNRGTLDFRDGEITIDGGVFDHSDDAGARDLGISGAGKGQSPHLRLVAGAYTAGIDAFDLGGNHGGRITLKEDSRVSVQSGLAVQGSGLLAGTGTVEGDVVVRGGTVRPGHAEDAAYDSRGRLQPGPSDDPTGTLHIDGDFEIRDGAVLDIGVGPDDENDGRTNAGIRVSGSVDIYDGIVRVTDYSNVSLRDGSEYTFLTADGALAGEFKEIVSFSEIYQFFPFYGANAASFEVRRLERYSDYFGEGERYHTKNRRRMVNTLEAAWAREALADLQFAMDRELDQVLQQKKPVSNLVETMDQLSPEPYQAAYRMAAEQTTQMNRRFLQGARTSRLQIGKDRDPGQGLQAMLASALAVAAPDPVSRDRFDPGAGIRGMGSFDLLFAANAGSQGVSDARARIVRGELGESIEGSGLRVFYGGYRRLMDIDESPARTGHDYKVRAGYLGVERERREGLLTGAGLWYANSEVDFDGNSGNLNMHTLRLGPHATLDRGALEIDIALNMGYHWNRQKRNMPHIDRQSVVRYNMWDGSVYTGARYNLSFRDRWLLTPAASLQYAHQYREGFTERRAEDARLKMGSDSSDVLRSLLGMHFSREFRTSRFVLVPEVFAGWEYDLLDPDMALDARFAEAPGSSFRVDADSPGRESVVYGGGLTFLFGDYNVAFATYELEKQDDGDGYTFSAGVKWNF